MIDTEFATCVFSIHGMCCHLHEYAWLSIAALVESFVSPVICCITYCKLGWCDALHVFCALQVVCMILSDSAILTASLCLSQPFQMTVTSCELVVVQVRHWLR